MYQRLVNNISFKIVLLAVLVFYIFFPTNNSSLDSFAYAGYVKYNEYLFAPHHLFANVLIYVLIYPLKLIYSNIDILSFSKAVNSVFQIINLYVFYKILTFLKIVTKEKILYILILGFSFSLWRYGTENETYIIPITFSLLGSFYFLKNFKNKKSKFILSSSFFGAIACLFHQIHFFWWLGILVGFYIYSKKIKTIILYIIPAFLVPLSYVLVLILYEKQELSIYNMMHFVFNDFYGGSIVTNFGWKGIFFQILNTVRTYFQIHPNIIILIKNNWLFIAPMLLTLYLGCKFVIQLLKGKSLIKREHNLILFIYVHIFILIINYLFAFYSYGNIEFMVLLPFLLFLCIAVKYQVNNKLLILFSTMLFVWNFSYAIFPNHFYNYYNDEKLVKFMKDNPDKTFIIKNATVSNQYFYKTGIDSPKNILSHYNLTEEKLRKLIDKKGEVYTDVIDKPEILNRGKIVSNYNSESFFKDYYKEKVFSYKGLYGITTVYKIKVK